MNSTFHHSRQSGFTLVETVVVLAMIGIIAGLLFPALASARRKGRDAACLNNLHQIGVATRLYADDNDGHYPYAIDPQSRDSPIDSFAPQELIGVLPVYPAVLTPYLKKPDIFRCPSDTQREFEKWGTSYFYNDSLVFYYSWDKVQAANASRISLYYDRDNWHGVIESSNINDYFVQVVYADLHVKKVHFNQLFDEELDELGEEGVGNVE